MRTERERGKEREKRRRAAGVVDLLSPSSLEHPFQKGFSLPALTSLISIKVLSVSRELE